MNSVIQQLYMTPGVPESVLGVEEDNDDEDRYELLCAIILLSSCPFHPSVCLSVCWSAHLSQKFVCTTPAF